MIVSTTLLGRGTAPVIREALRSVVMLVDACLVIDTGANQADVDEAKAAAGAKYVGRTWLWRDDFAAARNAALDMAGEYGYGARWALTVDSDERVDLLDVAALRRELDTAAVGALQAAHAHVGYVKPRLIRVPCRGAWRGPNHEGLYGVSTAVTNSLQFREAPRAAGHLDRKWRRNLDTLIPYSAAHPREQRWHYYVAEAHRGLGEVDEAIERYRRVVALDGWDEEGAWAAFRGAQLLCGQERFAEAIELCARGMARHAGVAELPWLAADAAYRLGRNRQAVYWAQLARVHDAESVACSRRIGFRDSRGLRQGPADVERAAGMAER
jgi:tetratricopeptide (TPR) repeat protein